MYIRPVAPDDIDPRPVCRTYGHTVTPITDTVDYCGPAGCGQRFPASDRPAPAVVELGALAELLAARVDRLAPDLMAELLDAARGAAVLLPADLFAPVHA